MCIAQYTIQCKTRHHGVGWELVHLHVAWPVLQRAPPMFVACSADSLLVGFYVPCQYVCLQAASEPWCSGSHLQHR